MTRQEFDNMLHPLLNLPYIDLLGRDKYDHKLVPLLILLSKLLGGRE